jgi:hypothetical protein
LRLRKSLSDGESGDADEALSEPDVAGDGISPFSECLSRANHEKDEEEEQRLRGKIQTASVTKVGDEIISDLVPLWIGSNSWE